MKELLKKAAIAGVGVFLLGGVAYANVGNDHTGYDSDNDASLESEYEAEVENDNDADIWNMIKGMASTGYNDAKYNTGNGEVDTGDAEGTVEIDNMANSNKTTVAGCGGCSFDGVDVTNSTTGADSHNDAWAKFEAEVKVENDNDADVDNHVCVTANSGSNDANYNTGNGGVTTGNSILDLAISNTLNTNETNVE